MKTYLDKDKIETSYQIAKAAYGSLGVDTDEAIAAAAKTPISLHRNNFV